MQLGVIFGLQNLHFKFDCFFLRAEIHFHFLLGFYPSFRGPHGFRHMDECVWIKSVFSHVNRVKSGKNRNGN